MELQEIVKKLNGKINPIGETNTDNERFENLKNQCDLVFKLLDEIVQVSENNKDAYEASRKKASEYASNFITNILGIK